VEREIFRVRAASVADPLGHQVAQGLFFGRADDPRPSGALLPREHLPALLPPAGGGDAFGLAFGAQLSLVLDGRGQDREHEPAILGRQVEVLGERDDLHPRAGAAG